MPIVKNIFRYIKKLPRLYSIGGGVVLLVVATLLIHFFTRSTAAPTADTQISHVHIASVASLSSQTGPLPVTGKVTSLSEATILAESSGEIISLSHSLGDHVAAGGVIATFENSSQQAAVLQAQGVYDSAEAALAKAQTTAANSNISSSQASQGAANAATSAGIALQSTYAALDDAVHTKADITFSNPRSLTPHFLVAIADGQLTTNIVNERSSLEGVLNTANTLSTVSADANLDTNITQMISSAQTVESFLNDVIEALNEAQASQSVSAATLASYQSSLAAARTEVVSAIASLNSAKAAYDSAQSGSQTASNSATQGTDSDIAVAQASVKQALGALDGARANLEKTIIRSPISGTIVSLPITQGDFVSSFSQVAEVSNPDALEVDTYVTPDDAKTLAVGGKAVIGTDTNGVIVSIAPALDPTTNKIEVKIGIVGDQSALTDGDTVAVSLDRVGTTTANKTPVPSTITIPIIAAKITPQGPIVFTVSSSTLVAQPITLGIILGDQVTVTGGLTADTDIVTDARGLSNGQTVIVDTN